MTTICQILSSADDNLWLYKTAEGLSIKNGMKFIFPFIEDKNLWILPPDVMYWDNWPVAQPSLLFAASAYNNEEYFLLWAKLDHAPQEMEVIRNLPVRNPIIWMQ
jgi:hypothetical protein